MLFWPVEYGRCLNIDGNETYEVVMVVVALSHIVVITQ